MPSNWTRAHDAWIARECEGLEVWVNAGDGAICDFQDDSIPNYLTDPAAAIRAAEAWRRRRDAREWTWRSEKQAGLHIVPAMAQCVDYYGQKVGNAEGDGCLAQALYLVTGGPA